MLMLVPGLRKMARASFWCASQTRLIWLTRASTEPLIDVDGCRTRAVRIDGVGPLHGLIHQIPGNARRLRAGECPGLREGDVTDRCEQAHRRRDDRAVRGVAEAARGIGAGALMCLCALHDAKKADGHNGCEAGRCVCGVHVASPVDVDAGEMPVSTRKVARCHRTLNALQISSRCSVNLPISPLRIKQLGRSMLDEHGAAPAAACAELEWAR